jgi:hypothetical protein
MHFFKKSISKKANEDAHHDGPKESFYLGINFVYKTFTYSQYNELVVFQCKVSD